MKRVLGLGNALVDILSRTTDDALLESLQLPKGSMQLVDVQQMQAIHTACQVLPHSMVAGGSASNTIVGLAELGVETGFVGKVGSDSLGSFYQTDLEKSGVKSHLLHSTTPTGRCQVIISPDSERTMATYLGAAVELVPDELVLEMFQGFDILHIEGYLVQNEALLIKVAELAKEAGLIISIDLASYNIVNENFDFLTQYVSKYVDILFANEQEALAFTKHADHEAAHKIAKVVDIAVVKVGSRGSFVQRGHTFVVVEPERVESVDTTGAGDLYASGFLYGVANDYDLDICGRIGSLCAAQVIQHVGAKIPAHKWEFLKASIAELLSE